MEFINNCFCIIERQCKCPSLFKCINLKQNNEAFFIPLGNAAH